MTLQCFADQRNRVHQSFGELFRPKMSFDFFDSFLPEFFPTFLMNAFIAYDRKLPNDGRDEDKDCIAFAGAIHFQAMKLPHGELLRVFDAGNVGNHNANFSGGVILDVGNRVDDAVGIDFR